MESITYLLKVSACTVLFFAIYLLVLRRLTFFKTNRFYLLLTLLLSFVIPTLNFTIERELSVTEVVHKQPTIIHDEVLLLPSQVPSQIEYSPVAEKKFDWYSLLPYLYFGIVACMLVIAIWRILQLVKHTRNGTEQINGLKIVSKTAGFTNCSFFNYVFIDNENLSEAELQVLLKHEQVHAKQLHSIDKIVLTFVKAFLWFNPVVYLYDKALEQTHEYEADEATSQNFGTAQYANLLLRLAIAKSEMPLVHNFVKSPIKERIKMLFNAKSKHMKKLMYLLALPVGLGLLWGFTVKVVNVANLPKVSNDNLIAKNKATLSNHLWGKSLKGKVKSILQTEVGEVLNFKYDKGLIRVLNLPKASVSVGDEVLITLGRGTTLDIKVFDAKGILLKSLDGPCYTMDMMKTLDGKVLFHWKNKPFITKGANMEFGKYKSEKIVLNTVSGKILSIKIVHGVPENQPSKVFIYSDGKLYDEEETLKFDKNFISKLSEKRGFSNSLDYSIPTLVKEKNAYVFWFGDEPKLSARTSKSRSYSQKYNGKTIDGQIGELTYSPTTKVMDGFLIKTSAGEILKANVEAKFANLTKTMISKGDQINVKVYNANHWPSSDYPVLTSYKLMKDGKLLFDRWPMNINNTKLVYKPEIKEITTQSQIKPVLIRSTALTVDTKKNINHIKNGIMKIGENNLEATEIIWDKANEMINATNAIFTAKSGNKISSNSFLYNLKTGAYQVVPLKETGTVGTKKNDVYYSTQDSAKIDNLNKIIYLYGKAELNLDSIQLNATHTYINNNTKIVTANDAKVTSKYSNLNISAPIIYYQLNTKK